MSERGGGGGGQGRRCRDWGGVAGGPTGRAQSPTAGRRRRDNAGPGVGGVALAAGSPSASPGSRRRAPFPPGAPGGGQGARGERRPRGSRLQPGVPGRPASRPRRPPWEGSAPRSPPRRNFLPRPRWAGDLAVAPVGGRGRDAPAAADSCLAAGGGRGGAERLPVLGPKFSAAGGAGRRLECGASGAGARGMRVGVSAAPPWLPSPLRAGGGSPRSPGGSRAAEEPRDRHLLR